MPEIPQQVLNISARELAEFVFRRGDLGGSGGFTGRSRALDGLRAHQKLQKSRKDDFEPEVQVTHTLQVREHLLKISGRIDGVVRKQGSALIEEIKTLQNGAPPVEVGPWHLAQAKVYAALFHLNWPAFTTFNLRITYLVLTTDELATFQVQISAAEALAFFRKALDEYLDWLQIYLDWVGVRDRSIRTFEFPHPSYRLGQRQLAVAVFRALRAKQHLFAEAPTGLGKTISTLFPTIKFLPESGARTIFYLTAKTLGRTVAEKAFQELRLAGLRIRSVTLTARDKICFNQGQPCDIRICPYALGYYDRIKPALRDLFLEEEWSKAAFERTALKHQVCPFELSLDASRWADAVIADYNYAFDPQASLRRFFGEEQAEVILLVDEAHNLLERAREMFSASLSGGELKSARAALKKAVPKCARAISKVLREFSKLELAPGGEEPAGVIPGLPPTLLPAVNNFLKKAEEWLVRNEPADFRETLTALYFSANSFLLTAAELGDEYAIIVEEEGQNQRSVRLFCLDPSRRLRQLLDKTCGAIFFSATLSPIPFFRDSLGGQPESAMLQLESPFPPGNLTVRINRTLATTYRSREGTSPAVARAIVEFFERNEGNTLVYFPSYRYLETVHAEAARVLSGQVILRQQSGMSEADRERFLQHFIQKESKVLGFALMGGFFGEGIDLRAEALSNVVVVGVGMPQICLERECIRQYFQSRNGSGFEYAYVFPGMNRVIQAVGRLIRSEEDRGQVLLIDARFSEPRFSRLFPNHWRPAYAPS